MRQTQSQEVAPSIFSLRRMLSSDASHVQSTKDDVSVVNAAFDQFGSQGFDVASSSAAQCWVGLTSAYLPHDSIVTILTQSTSGIGDR